MAFIKANFQFLLILVLFGILLLQTCNKPTPVDQKPTIVTVVDTSWKHMVQPVTNVYPTITTKVPYVVGVDKGKDTLYIPSTNDSILRLQYQALRDSILAQNIYKQTLKYDSSSVTLTDTITNNHLTGRSYSFDIKYPVITNTTTITIPPKPTSQLYVGGGMFGNPSSLINGAKAGFVYKSKKDQIYQVNAIQQFSGQTYYELSTYWKIKLHK